MPSREFTPRLLAVSIICSIASVSACGGSSSPTNTSKTVSDPAGDTQDPDTQGKPWPRPEADLLKFSVSRDGKDVTFQWTTKEPPRNVQLTAATYNSIALSLFVNVNGVIEKAIIEDQANPTNAKVERNTVSATAPAYIFGLDGDKGLGYARTNPDTEQPENSSRPVDIAGCSTSFNDPYASCLYDEVDVSFPVNLPP